MTWQRLSGLLPGIEMANKVAGPVDVIAVAVLPHVGALEDVVFGDIRSTVGGYRTYTCLAVDYADS